MSVLEFGRVQRRKVDAEFSGGEITSDGGVLLLRQADRRTGFLLSSAYPLQMLFAQVVANLDSG